jgi:hypothetical protein
MITAFCFMTVAALAFRSRQQRSSINNNNSNHQRRVVLKFTHGLSWTVAALCAMVALLAVVQSHNDATVSGKFIANLYSLHSWIGVGVIIMYMVQFSMGVLTFACPTPLFMSLSSPNKKARFMQVHKFLGPFIYNCTAATILLGIQEKEGFIGCSYAVAKVDLFPPSHFFEIPYSCRVSHLLGVLVLAVTLCTNLALHEFQKGASVDTASSHHRDCFYQEIKKKQCVVATTDPCHGLVCLTACDDPFVHVHTSVDANIYNHDRHLVVRGRQIAGYIAIEVFTKLSEANRVVDHRSYSVAAGGGPLPLSNHTRTTLRAASIVSAFVLSTSNMEIGRLFICKLYTKTGVE